MAQKQRTTERSTAKKTEREPEEDDDRAEAEAADDEADEADDGEAESGDDDDGAKVARHESTKGVAKALGVDENENEEEAEDEEQGASDASSKEPAAAPNRAARRREEARKRREARTARPAETDDDSSEKGEEEVAAARDALPKDRNARAKELLKRRQEAAARPPQTGLSAGEAVQDQLARAASGGARWLRDNLKTVLGVIVVGTLGTVGVFVYLAREEAARGRASDGLMAGVMAERGYVFDEGHPDKRSDEIKEIDFLPAYKSYDERNDAVLAAYTKVADENKGAAAGILGKLGQGGAYLRKGEYDKAIAVLDEVVKSDLAKADVDIKARALEAKGFAYEGKKDYEAALNTFRELENLDKSFEDLAKYHQGRVSWAKGDVAKAKELLTALSKKLELPSLDGPPQGQLRVAVDEYLRYVDPTNAPKKRPVGGPDGKISPEELEQLQRQLQRQMQQQGQQGQDGEGPDMGDDFDIPMPEDMPPPPEPPPAPPPPGK
ncbi:MAG: hypothetical protein U0271_32715 [Polyangiaceae bacterium]